jgi:polyisoprenyl-phosphate glycosyltransferase
MEKSLDNPTPRVTIITPVYNEEESLPIYRDEVSRILLDHPDFDFEVLFVDDGSSDKSWDLIQQYCDDDARFRALKLSRNFGAHAALGAGIDRADGDAIAILACDLQDPPSVILEFLSEWREGKQIVWGKRRSRKDAGWRVLASRAFSSVIRKHAMPKGSQFTTGSFFLMDQRVAECCRQFPERNRITFALVAYTGFDQTVVEYDRTENPHQPVRRRERKQQRFKSPGSAQRFLNVRSAVYKTFYVQRHLLKRATFKQFRCDAFDA